MHMLLDFMADSSPVIDAEFHLGGGFMGRGIPWITRPGSPLSHFSWKAKFFHESTHIGDEYLDDIRKAQAASPMPGFIHPNVSYLAWEVLLAVDGEVGPSTRCVDPSSFKERSSESPDGPAPRDTCSGIPNRPRLYWRGYAGYRRLLGSPYDLTPIDPATGLPMTSPFFDPPVTHAGNQNEGQVGGEGRLRLTALDDITFRPPDYIIAAAELKLRQQYDYEGSLGSPRWTSYNVLAGVEWGDWTDDQMVFRTFVNYYDGINPHGQFRSELLRYVGVTVQIDY